jgi:hypothetical protein
VRPVVQPCRAAAAAPASIEQMQEKFGEYDRTMQSEHQGVKHGGPHSSSISYSTTHLFLTSEVMDSIDSHIDTGQHTAPPLHAPLPLVKTCLMFCRYSWQR